MVVAREGRAVVGRDAELAVVADALEAVAAGASRTLLLSGEAGIGKSALLEEVAARGAASGALVLRGRASEQEAEVPFGLAIDVLDDRAGDLGDAGQAISRELSAVLPSLAGTSFVEAPTTAAQRFRFHRSLRAMVDLLAGRRAVVLVLDDLHWADEASLEWVLHLVRRPLRAPHLLALGARPVGPFARVLDALRTTPSCRHLELQPLDADGSLALLAGVADERRRRALAQESGGNPLFLLELARLPDTVDRLPATVMAAIGLEVDALDPDVRAVLQAASVVGDPFDPDLAVLAAGADGDPGGLDALVGAGLVRLEGTRALRFRHPLVRRAVYDAAPLTARQAAHARVAQVLRSRGEPESAYARHLERIVRPEDEADLQALEAAAGQVLARSPLTAARWLRQAADLRSGAAPHERAERLSHVAHALLVGGRPADAHDALVVAIDGLEAWPTDDLRLQLIAFAADVKLLLGRPEAAQLRVREALDALDATADATTRARLTFRLAMAAGHRSQSEEFFELAGQAAPALAISDPAMATSDRAIAVHAALWRGRYELIAEREALARRAWAELDPATLRAHPEVAFYVGQFLSLTQRNHEALEVAEQGLAAVRAGGNDGALVMLLVLHLQALYLVGDVRGARAALAVCEEASQLQGAMFGISYAAAVRVALARLDADGAEVSNALEAWQALRPRVDHDGVRRIGDCHVARLIALKDPARGSQLAEQATGSDFSVGDFDMTTRLIPPMVAAELAAGRPDRARAAAAIGRTRAEESQMPVAEAAALVAAAELSLADGDDATAARSCERAAQLAAAHSYLELAFHADLLRARAIAAGGDREGAIELLRAAAERATQAAATTLVEEAASELRRLGSRLPTVLVAQAEAGELTDRERQVAEIVAAGRTNREAGALLFLSPKTVEHTLSRVYAKLGVRSRTELAAAMTTYTARV